MTKAYDVAANIYESLSPDQRRNMKLFRKQAAISWLAEHRAECMDGQDFESVAAFLQAMCKENK